MIMSGDAINIPKRVVHLNSMLSATLSDLDVRLEELEAMQKALQVQLTIEQAMLLNKMRKGFEQARQELVRCLATTISREQL